VGRIYEDRHALPHLRWFWSITVYADPKRGINTSGRAASLDEAKAQFLPKWQRCVGVLLQRLSIFAQLLAHPDNDAADDRAWNRGETAQYQHR